MKRILYALAVFALSAAAAGAAPAPHPHYNVAPPGTVVQDTVAYLTGEAMNSAWHVVASRKMVGKQMGDPVYQYYLSFYAPAADGASNLVYQVPNKSSDWLEKVTKAPSADLYFPHQNLQIVGAGELEQQTVQDVVILSHQAGADCGSADLTVFGADTHGKVQQRVHIQNGCDLRAKIVKKGQLQAVQLSGPYYGPKAPMCCPTKPHATAMLTYGNGKWSVKPNYFAIMKSTRQ